MHSISLCRNRAWTLGAIALVPTLGSLVAPTALAYDVNDNLKINVLAAGTYQCQEVSGGDEGEDACRGAAPIQPELVYAPTEQDEIFVKLGFAAGNGLNPVSPFVLAPWAADLEDDVQDVNGRDRSYLLEAWYAHTFRFGETNTLQITGGIVDPAFYVNENAYANDEYTQFMNEAFVNSRNALLPAYDWGGVLVWKLQDWTFSAVGMNVGENDDGNNYNFYAVEADYHIETALGEGNYRVMVSGTSSAFPDLDGEELERRSALNLSFDQALGPIVGAFLRLGWQAEDAAVDFKAVYSGGFDFKGSAWGREGDNIGIGYAYLDGGNLENRNSQSVEAYYRLAVNDYLALTADVQYLKDDYVDADVVEGWVLGMRGVVEF
jgi:porin